MPLYKTEAINLKSMRLGEADKLMTLFTRSHGKIGAVAKSALKSGSRFGGRLELFAYNNILLAKGKNLDIVSQIETIDMFHRIRENEQSLQAALYISKMTVSFLEERVRHDGLFDLVIECLNLLKSGVTPAIVTRIFDVKFADIEGVLPIAKFPEDSMQCVMYLRGGIFDAGRFSAKQLRDVDEVLALCLSDHIGKDIRSWKSQ